MTTISLHEAKTHFSAVVAGVERSGEPVIIQKHGKAVVEIVPMSRGSRLGIHPMLKQIKIKGDLTESTEKEWSNV